MTLDDALLFATAALLGGNHLVVRIPGWERRVWAFWLMQALDLAACIYFAAWGMPAFTQGLPIVNWAVALLFAWHVVHNNHLLVQARAQGRAQRIDKKTEARKEAIRRALHAGEARRTERDGEAAE